MNPHRTILLLVLCLLTGLVQAQIKPSGFSYQTVVMRDKAPLFNTRIKLVATLHTQSNVSVWREELNTRTDASGVASINIGQRNAILGGTPLFSNVDFGGNHLWLKVEITSPFQLTVTDEPLPTVPYARYAKRGPSSVPAGTIVAFAGDTNKIPVGWKHCNGIPLRIDGIDTLSGTPLSRLFNVIGYNWGRGPANGTFRLPDLRGMFLRGVDAGSGRDPNARARHALYPGGAVGDHVGSYQSDTLGSHQHTTNMSTNYFASGTSQQTHFVNPGGGQSLISTQPVGGAETRPKNAYVYYIIKL